MTISTSYRIHRGAAVMTTRARTPKRPPEPVHVDYVHPVAMREARRIAGGHTNLLRVLDANTVLVLNVAGQKFRRNRGGKSR